MLNCLKLQFILDYVFQLFFIYLKDVGDDNWALFYTFSSEVSEKPGFRNNYFFPQIRSTTLKEGASTIQSI